MHTVVRVAALALALALGAHAQDYAASCASWSLASDGHTLSGTCTAIDGSSVNSSLDLDTCIGVRPPCARGARVC